MRLTCKEVSMLVSQQLDRKLSLWERATLRLHLLVCNGCRNFLTQTQFIRRAVRRMVSAENNTRARTPE